jgi:hypothetical protein
VSESPLVATAWPGEILLEGAWNNGVSEKRSLLGGDLMNQPVSSWSAAKHKLIWVKIKMTHNRKIALLLVVVVVFPLALEPSEGTLIALAI